MPDRQAGLRQLALVEDEVVDMALVEALPSADSPTRRALVATLLERRHPSGLAGLVQHYHHLGEPAQQLIRVHIDCLDEALRHAADGRAVQTRLNMLDIVDQSGEARAAYLLTSQLHGTDARLQRGAARALLRMVRAQRSGRASARPDAQSRAHVYEAVVEACACFHQHRRRDVLLAAALYAPRFGPDLLQHVADRHASAHAAMCELLAQADHPLTCGALVPLAAIESMRDAAIRGLENRGSAAHLDAITQMTHLLAAPVVLRGVRHAQRVAHLAPHGRSLAQLDTDCRRRLPRWVAAMPVLGPARRQTLGELTGDRDATTRLMALRGLMAIGEDEADTLIEPLCFDTDPAIARIALRHLLRRRWPGLSGLMVRLIGSSHAELREIAERQLGPIGFERFWCNWPQLPQAKRVAAARALMKIDAGFGRQLARKMSASDVDDRLRAVMVVRELGQEASFDRLLLTRAADADARVASAAVKALAPLGPTPPVVAALTEALGHDNDRVRSNAIEALEAMEHVGPLREALLALTHGRANRSRATAIKALLALPMSEALPELERMLGDDNEAHRVSALWVVERLGLLPVVNRVAALARSDAQPRVRRRAVRVVRDLAAAHLAKQKGSA